ncbi:hypothetical protein [Roseovarius salis]|uniref:hypothetical protein n=1 Tax=Roseovarius salis TaxID=3376063 RepID=UPI0037C79DEE
MTKNRKLLLHIGPHKTGSTAIQRGLESQAGALASNDWKLERFTTMQGGPHRLADLLSVDRREEARPYSHQLRNATDNIILSSENFSRLNEAQARDFVEAIGFDEIRVVYYLRNPLTRLESAWRERVKHGYRYTLVEFIAGRLARPFNDADINDSLKIQPWANAVGLSALDIHLYDKIDDVSAHFLSTYFPEVTTESCFQQSKVNLSYGAEKTEILRALAGFQTHLLNNRDYDDDIDALRAQISRISTGGSFDYRREFTLSMNSPVMMRLEKMLSEYFGNCLIPRPESELLFEKRTVTWNYLAPEIWLEQPDLTAKLFTLRQKLLDELGNPIFDQRLKKL